jgi:hypothetical protein
MTRGTLQCHHAIFLPLTEGRALPSTATVLPPKTRLERGGFPTKARRRRIKKIENLIIFSFVLSWGILFHFGAAFLVVSALGAGAFPEAGVVVGVPTGAGGKRSGGIGLMSIFAVFRSAVRTSF